MRFQLSLLAGAVLTLTLAGCGSDNGSSNQPAVPKTSAIRVVGDSLSDSGTFGNKFTITSANAADTKVWVDFIAASLGAPALCPRYTFTSGAVALNPAAAACTGYAVGGAQVNITGTGAADTTPFTVGQQLKDMIKDKATFGPEELLIVDGGGNDAATLFGAFLAPDKTSFVSLVSEALPAATVGAGVQAGANGLVSLGVAYMTALANQLADSVTANGIDKGAMRVAILNVPDITKTPRFIAVLKQVSDASGGGAVGAATAAQVSGIANLWVNAFNTQLNARFKDNAKVQMLDFYTWFNVWLSKPADYGITNTTEPACPGPINVCTATALDAIAGKTAGWWKSYSFSDSFHGTPATNKLMADNVLYLLNKKGWY